MLAGGSERRYDGIADLTRLSKEGAALGKDTHYAYLLLCADGTIYSGYTTDPERRAAEHNSGKGAKYTRTRLPVRLVRTESFPTKSEAMRREAALKRLSHAEKLLLIRQG